MTKFDFTKSSFCLITGASRGIGRTIALEFARRMKNNNTTCLLMATSISKLESTKQEMHKINPNINVVTIVCDLSKPSKEQFEEIIKLDGQFDNAIIIHNAGSIGHIDQKAVQLDDLNDWIDYYTLNFFSAAILNSVFVRKVSTCSNIFIVNITSLAGRKALNAMAQYGSGKAARDLFFQVLAAEEERITVLNYSPGPVQTDMTENIVQRTVDNKLRSFFSNIIQEKTILSPEMTVGKFLNILEEGKYTSGDVIDYYDA